MKEKTIKFTLSLTPGTPETPEMALAGVVRYFYPLAKLYMNDSPRMPDMKCQVVDEQTGELLGSGDTAKTAWFYALKNARMKCMSRADWP